MSLDKIIYKSTLSKYLFHKNKIFLRIMFLLLSQIIIIMCD